MSEYLGKLTEVEGLDGCGKSTQVIALGKRLDSLGIQRVITREHWPEDILGQAIHAVVEIKEAKLDSTALQLTFVGNRINHTIVQIIPALKKGLNVFSDRYLESTLAYADDQDRPIVIALTEMLITRGKILRPDLSILIDVPAEEAMKRLGIRKAGTASGESDTSKVGRQSIFEKEQKLKRVRQNYLERFGCGAENKVIVSGLGSEEEVQMRIRRVLLAHKIYKEL